MLRNIILLLAATILFGGSLGAADIVWTGATNASWTNTGNWQGGTVPVAGDVAVFDGTGTLPGTITGVNLDLDGIRVNAASPITVTLQLASVVTLSGGSGTVPAVELTGSNSLAVNNSTTNILRLAGEVQVEDGNFTVSDAVELGLGNQGAQFEVVQDNGNISFGATTVLEVNGVSTGDSTEVQFKRKLGGTGTLTFASLTIESDTDTAGAASEDNAARLSLKECDATVTGTINLEDGTGTSPNAGRGSELGVRDATLNVGVNINLGNGASSDPDSGSSMEIDNTTLIMSSGGTLSVNARCTFIAQQSTVTGSGAYTFTSVATSDSVIFLSSTLTAQSAGDLTVSLDASGGGFGLGIALIGSNFSNYDSSGVEFGNGALLGAINECNFTNGQSGGSHITVNGNFAGGSTVVADLNQFDLSTGTTTTSWVNVVSATQLFFRIGSGQDFGFGATNVNPSTAESYDNDGAWTPPAFPTGIIAWGDIFTVLTASVPTSGQPTGMSAAVTADQPLFFFDLAGTVGNSQITDVQVELEFDDSQGTNFSEADVQTVTLFHDANSNGQLDTGETITTTSGGATTVIFPSFTRTINQGASETWGIAITFANSVVGKSGRVSMFILPTIGIVAVDASTPAIQGIVGGLPVLMNDSIPVHGAADSLQLREQPNNAAENTAFGRQPEVVVVDANGEECGLDNSTTITPSISTDPVGGSSLIGTDAGGITVVAGHAVFTDLGIDQAGQGFELTFTASPVLATSSTVVTQPFDVSAPPPEIDVERITGTSIPDNTGTDDIGNQSTLSNVVLTYTILNAGPGTLNVGSVTFPGTPTNCTPSLSSTPAPTVAPSSSTTFQVTVSLAGPVAFDFEISIVNDDSNENPYNFTVQGNGIEPDIEIRYNSIAVTDGGSHAVTGAAATTVLNVQYTIVNTGTEDLTLNATPVSAVPGTTGNCTIGTITQPGTLTVAANGGSTTFTVPVTPTAAGAFDFDVTVGSNDPDEDPYDVTGNGTASAAPEPEIDVLRGGTSIPSGNTDNLSNLPLNTDTVFTWDIENIGSADLTISGVTISGEVMCTVTVSQAAGSPVAAGNSTSLGITINPIGANFSFTITITNNDSDEGSYVVNVSGTASATTPEINVQRSGTNIADAGTDDVGSHAAGTPVTFTYTIQNTGTAVLNLGASAVSVSNAVGCTVTVTTQPGTTVATSASDTFDVEVTPAGGAFSFEIAISNDDANENPYNISVIGNQGGSGGGGGGGGDDDGGCSTGGSTTWLWLALLALAAGRVILRRRDA